MGRGNAVIAADKDLNDQIQFVAAAAAAEKMVE